MGLLVSIHDVAPVFADECTELWSMCRVFGATPALLIVPNWHGQWPLANNAKFVDWIHSCVDVGAEILLHGERHDEAGLARSWRDSARAFGRTAREGEFLTLRDDGARARIERGLALFAQLGLNPIGFVPPAWLAREDTHDAARAAGLHLSEDATGVRKLTLGIHVRAPALRWSGRSSFRARASVALAQVRWHRHRNTAVVRLALHPQDLANSVTRASVQRELERWISRNPVMRYDEL